MKLSELKINVETTIIKIEATREFKKRLFDMGLTSGVKVKIVSIAPMGDPILLNIRDYFLSIRKAEAQLIEVSND